jgi:hypothetical protein
LHWARAATSVRARSLGFWNEASPHLPTISSARIVAGISATGAGSGAAEGDDEKEGRLILLHAPKKIASIEAIPRLAAVRPEPTINSPKTNPRPHPSGSLTHQPHSPASLTSQTQKPCRSNDVLQITPARRYSFRKASYMSLTKALTSFA